MVDDGRVLLECNVTLDARRTCTFSAEVVVGAVKGDEEVYHAYPSVYGPQNYYGMSLVSVCMYVPSSTSYLTPH